MAGQLDLTEVSLCPCGEEPVDRRLHALGASCRDRALKHVRRRFGPHQFGGRCADEVDDVVQECFRLLLLPSGLASFEPDPARQRGDVFRAWLWRVIHRHCNSKAASLRKEWKILVDEGDDPPDPDGALTPEQIFARTRLRELHERAVREVQLRWRAKGAPWGERFDAVLPLVHETETDTDRVCEQLGIDDGYLRVIKCRLTKAMKREIRQQIREELRLDLETDREPIERKIDEETASLFQMAYPERDPCFLFSKDPKPDPIPTPEPQGDPDPNDGLQEVTP